MSEGDLGLFEWSAPDDAEIIQVYRAGEWLFQEYERVLGKVIEYCDVPNRGYRTVLNIGAAPGNLVGRLLALGMDVYAIDPSEAARKRYQQRYPDVFIAAGDFLSIPLYFPRFDLIVSAYTFHRLSPVEKVEAVVDMKKALNARGRIVIADLMFRNAAEERRVRQAWRASGRTDIFQELEGKYPALFEETTIIFSEEGFSVQGERLTESVWIISASL